MRSLVAVLLVMSAVSAAQASPLTLVSGNTEAFVGSAVTTIPFSAAEVANASDANSATGVSFTSVPDPLSGLSFGLDQTFEFDVSGLSNIQSITFTWTGRYTWEGLLPDAQLQLGPQEGLPTTPFNGFGSGSTPNGEIQTASLVVTAGAVDPQLALASSLVNPGLAQFNIETLLGSIASTALSSLTLETLEVTADVEFGSVPEPSTLSLIGAAFVAAGLRRRARASVRR